MNFIYKFSSVMLEQSIPCWFSKSWLLLSWFNKSEKNSESWNIKIIVLSFIRNLWSRSSGSRGLGICSIRVIWRKSSQLGKLNTNRLSWGIRQRATALSPNLCKWAVSLLKPAFMCLKKERKKIRQMISRKKTPHF